MVSYLVAFKVHASLLSLKAKVTKSIKIATTLLTHWNHKRASNIKKKNLKIVSTTVISCIIQDQ